MHFFVVPLLLGLQATPLPRRPLPLRASPPLMGARPPPGGQKYVPEGRDLRGGLPEEVFSKTNFATGGARTADTVKNIETLWKTFKACYPSEQAAKDAAKKNSAVFSPQINSPRKIKGSFGILVKRFGKREAQSLIQRNPGILVNSPEGLDKCSDKEILDSVALVETLDANKPLISALAGIVWFGVLFGVGFRILQVQECTNIGISVINCAPGPYWPTA